MPKTAPPRSTKINVKTGRFEAFIGGSWAAFEGEVTRTKTNVSIARMVTPETGKPFKLTTVFNLALLPAYSFA